MLLSPLPIHDPSRLVVCWGTDQPHHLPVLELTYRTVEMFSRQSHSFSQTAAMGIHHVAGLAEGSRGEPAGFARPA